MWLTKSAGYLILGFFRILLRNILLIDAKILILFLCFFSEKMENVKKTRVHSEVGQKSFKSFFGYFQFSKRV